MDNADMDIPSEALWDVIETLLDSGREPLARTAFRWSSEYAFFCGLKNARTPVVITKFEPCLRPLRFHLDTQLDQAWKAVIGHCRCRDWPSAKAAFVEAVNSYYLYAIEVSKYGAREDKEGVWSVNKWH
jgi:hypothetical protein